MSTQTKKREAAPLLTYFVVQGFQQVKRAPSKISADEPIPTRDHDHTMRIFARISAIRAGCVAFRRTGSPVTGEWEDAVIIAKHGIVPEGELEHFADETELASDHWGLSEGDLKRA